MSRKKKDQQWLDLPKLRRDTYLLFGVKLGQIPKEKQLPPDKVDAYFGVQKKFIVTLWRNLYDYDGLTSDFLVFDKDFDDLESAKKFVGKNSREMIKAAVIENKNGGLMEVDAYKKRPPLKDVNKNNEIIYSGQAKIGDGTGYNSVYFYFDVIALDRGTKIGPNLFNLEDCAWEVKEFYEHLA